MGNVQSPPGAGKDESKISASVSKIHIDGVERTKEDVLRDRVKHVFKAKYFDDLILSAQDARFRLQTLGCFSEVGVRVDTDGRGGPHDYEVVFTVKEFNRIRGAVNTLFGNQQGSLQCGLIFPNIYGRGERLSTDYTRGFRESVTFNGTLTKPLMHNAAVAGSIFQQMASYPASGFKETNRGVALDLTFMSGPQLVHNLSYEGVWRDLRCIEKDPTFDVLKYSGHSLKSSIKHILTLDRRNDAIFPRCGPYFRLNQEFAGLGGDIGFLKNEVEFQLNLPVIQDFVLQLSLHGGYIKAYLDSNKYTSLVDKFFVGGPMNVRGFHSRGLGPQSNGNSIGSDSYWAVGTHLFAPIPFGRGGFGDLFRFHGFLTSGNTEIKNIRDARVSTGLGLAFKLGGMARIELNYCFPIISKPGDKIAPGIQIGVGINFL